MFAKENNDGRGNQESAGRENGLGYGGGSYSTRGFGNISGDGIGFGFGGSDDHSAGSSDGETKHLNRRLNMTTNTYEGKYVIVRAEGPGVHFGLLKEYDPELKIAYLEKARHLYLWTGFTLYAVANHGMADDQAKVSQECPEVMINNVLTLHTCSEKAIKNLSEYPSHLG